MSLMAYIFPEKPLLSCKSWAKSILPPVFADIFLLINNVIVYFVLPYQNIPKIGHFIKKKGLIRSQFWRSMNRTLALTSGEAFGCIVAG